MSTSSNTNDPPPPSGPSQWRPDAKEGANIKMANTTGQFNVHDLEKTKVHRELSKPGCPGAVSIDNTDIDQSKAVKGNTQRAASPRSTTTTEETQESQRLQFLKRKLEELDNDLNFGGRDLRDRVRSDRDILRERADVSAEIKREERTSWLSATNRSCSAIFKSVRRYLGAYRLNSGLGVAIIVAIGASGCAALLVRGGFLVGIVNAAGGYMMRSPMDEVHGMEDTDRRVLAGHGLNGLRNILRDAGIERGTSPSRSRPAEHAQSVALLPDSSIKENRDPHRDIDRMAEDVALPPSSSSEENRDPDRDIDRMARVVALPPSDSSSEENRDSHRAIDRMAGARFVELPPDSSIKTPSMQSDTETAKSPGRKKKKKPLSKMSLEEQLGKMESDLLKKASQLRNDAAFDWKDVAFRSKKAATGTGTVLGEDRARIKENELRELRDRARIEENEAEEAETLANSLKSEVRARKKVTDNSNKDQELRHRHQLSSLHDLRTESQIE